MMNKEDHNVEVIERYHDYTPPFPIKEIVTARLCGISAHHLQGLGAVLLTNYEGLNRQRRRQKIPGRNHKIEVANCGGLYHQKWQGDAATIEIFIDNIISRSGYPKWMFRIQFFQGMIIGKTLFHEIGHHVQATQFSEYKQSEEIAEEWRKRLTREYGSKRFWYLKPLNPLFKLLMCALRAITKKPHRVDVVKQRCRK